MTSRFMRAAIVLGLLSAIGPFAIDMYLPALPSIGKSLGADVGTVQLSLMVFFMSMGVGQLIYGPLSDMIGRKRPIYIGLSIFALGSIGCAMAPDIHTLIFFRFVQGLGACAGMVIPRAIVRDMHTGTDAARLMSLLMLIFSVSPVLAPLTGSLVIKLASWRGIFWVVTGAAGLGLLMVATVLKETRPAEHRRESGIASAMAGYRTLLGDRHFLGVVFIGAFGIASFFAYLANSSFVLINHYGLTPTQYSLAFSVNAVSFIGASQFTARFGGRYGLKRVVRTAVIGYAVTMVLLAAITASGVDRLGVMMGLLVVGYGFLGLVIPSSAVIALEEHGAIAGTASALMGTLQFGTGALVIAILGRFIDGTSLPMVMGIAACSLISLTFARVTLRTRKPVVETCTATD
ncbi:DHA1 family bicyclomycin/chloramphenicol resistance-like MFS transporter [Luteibacter rhizovicinus]|uniref:Bcr/CflA family efflux transporter n=1 Tax=Luteibacter rhizovicinus TaxID=242606 RepID=A0A4R3Z1B8_9GAMM|nr:multidrug effflux MFS transporter [Luteibacter rhizovicinus]TCV97644.1 DHA1 family bicyclomycin/chloramphenicol resistance-like MFS transporter [Luteibacter rhizovicinus]